MHNLNSIFVFPIFQAYIQQLHLKRTTQHDQYIFKLYWSPFVLYYYSVLSVFRMPTKKSQSIWLHLTQVFEFISSRWLNGMFFFLTELLRFVWKDEALLTRRFFVKKFASFLERRRSLINKSAASSIRAFASISWDVGKVSKIT